MPPTTSINTGPINPFPQFTAWYVNFFTYLFTHPGDVWHSFISSAPFFVFGTLLAIASICFFVGTVYVIIRSGEIRKKMNASSSTSHLRMEKVRSKRWDVVEKHMHSDNASEWRLAIIEADTLLEEAVKKMGYDGDSLGEMLKKIDISSLNSLNEAWEAHKIRNLIAHKGSAFILTKHEARRIVALYEKVFRELEII